MHLLPRQERPSKSFPQTAAPQRGKGRGEEKRGELTDVVVIESIVLVRVGSLVLEFRAIKEQELLLRMGVDFQHHADDRVQGLHNQLEGDFPHRSGDG